MTGEPYGGREVDGVSTMPPATAQTEVHAEPSASAKMFAQLRAIAETLILTIVIFFVVQTFVAQPYVVEQVSMEQSLLPGQSVLVDKLTPRFDDYSRGDIVVFRPPLDEVEEQASAGTDGTYRTTRPYLAGSLKVSQDGADLTRGTDFFEVTPGSGTFRVADAVDSSIDLDVTYVPVGDSGSETPFIKRVIGLPGDLVQLRDGVVWINDVKLDEPYTWSEDEDPARTEPLTDVDEWRIEKDTLFVMGDHRPQSVDSRSFGPISRSEVIGRAVLRYWPLDKLSILQTPTYSDVPAAAPPAE